MYLTPYQKKQLTTVLILVIGIPLTLLAIYAGVSWFSSAGADNEPKDVVISNITTNSITITWTTETKVTGSVVPILNGNELNPVIDRRGNGRYLTHYIEVKELEPTTKYSFKIVSGDDIYTNTNGQPLEFTTANISTDTPTPQPIHGNSEGGGEDVIIYVLTKNKNTYPISSTASSAGNWLLDLSAVRLVSDKSMYTVSGSEEVVVLVVGGVGKSGKVEGAYDTIFDSNGKLNTDLVLGSSSYSELIPNEAKLSTQEQTTPTPTPTPTPSPTPTPTPTPEEPEEEFERDYRLRSDLSWIDLVSSESSSLSPTIYGANTIQVTNLTDVGFTVIWMSEQEEVGYVMYGTTNDDLADRGRDQRDSLSSQNDYYLHYIEISQLQPETTYYVQPYSGEETLGEVLELTTLKLESSPPQFETVVGKFDVEDVDSAVVIAYIKDDDGSGTSGESYPISTLLGSSNDWILTIGGVREEEGGYFQKNDNDLIVFEPFYLNTVSPLEVTISQAKASEVLLSSTGGTFTTFRKFPRLSDYGILVE